MALQIYDQLLQFPLFLGMSRDDLSQVAAHTKFDFVKEEADSPSVFRNKSKLAVKTVTRIVQRYFLSLEDHTAPGTVQPHDSVGNSQLSLTCQPPYAENFSVTKEIKHLTGYITASGSLSGLSGN